MSGDLFDLSGRTALVTGSTRGLGVALARALGEAGARVIINGRSLEAAGERADAFRADGLDAVACAFDVSDPASVAAAAPALAGVDILVNNAGITNRKRILEYSVEEWKQIIDGNLTSAFLIARTVVPGMIERGNGKVINIGSVLSELGRVMNAPYASTKGGIRMLTRAMCAEWAPLGIQANAIGPGYFSTELTKTLEDDVEFSAWLRSRVPTGRWAQPEELAGAVVFLASRASDFVNGQILYVDGGLTATV
jgi:gluconate 5-dehydrogenase